MFGIDPLCAWAILLLLMGISCVVLEMFVPSGGMLGVLAAMCLIASLVLAFMSGRWFGTGMTLAITLLIPLVLAVAVKFWPHTPLGKLILLAPPENPDDVLPATDAYRSRQLVVGKLGVAQSAMLPSGMVLVEGQSYDAISSGLPIEIGQTIRVVGLDMQRVVVRLEAQPQVVPLAAPEIEDPFA